MEIHSAFLSHTVGFYTTTPAILRRRAATKSSSCDAAGLRAQLDFTEYNKTFKHRRERDGETASCRCFLRLGVRKVARGADQVPANTFMEETPANCGITSPGCLTGENYEAEITRRVSGGVCVSDLFNGCIGCTFTPTPRQKHHTVFQLLTLTGIIRVRKKERFSSTKKYFCTCLVKCRIKETDTGCV